MLPWNEKRIDGIRRRSEKYSGLEIADIDDYPSPPKPPEKPGFPELTHKPPPPPEVEEDTGDEDLPLGPDEELLENVRIFESLDEGLRTLQRTISRNENKGHKRENIPLKEQFNIMFERIQRIASKLMDLGVFQKMDIVAQETTAKAFGKRLEKILEGRVSWF